MPLQTPDLTSWRGICEPSNGLQSILAHRINMSGKDLKDVAQFFWTKIRQQSLRLRADPVQFAQVQNHYRGT